MEVGKIDEVVGRLAGGFGFNMKAYVVSRKGFASGALATAKSNGIGLIKIIPADKVTFFAHLQTFDSVERSNREFPNRARAALLNPNYISDGESFYAFDHGYVFATLSGVVGTYLREHAVETSD